MVLGGLGVVLNRSWAVLGRHGSFRVALKPTGTCGASHLGALWGAKMEPKWEPRGAKIEDKNEDEKRRFRRSSWSRLGAILSRLGCRLGALEALQTLRLPMFREN